MMAGSPLDRSRLRNKRLDTCDDSAMCHLCMVIDPLHQGNFQKRSTWPFRIWVFSLEFFKNYHNGEISLEGKSKKKVLKHIWFMKGQRVLTTYTGREDSPTEKSGEQLGTREANSGRVRHRRDWGPRCGCTEHPLLFCTAHLRNFEGQAPSQEGELT